MGSRERPVNNSEFNMWRAVFAFALVDKILSMEEQGLLKVYYSSIPFSQTQREILKNDFLKQQDVEKLYNKVTDPEHKTRFCALARALVWCEGDMDKQEEEILKRVKCLSRKEDEAILRESRIHPHLKDYYQHYAHAGVAGLVKARPTMSFSV